MKKLWLLCFAVSCIGRADTVALTGAKVWTNGSDQPVENATVIIDDEHIRSIVASGPVPADARLIGITGSVITAPLDAAATQIGLVDIASDASTDDRGVSGGELGAAFDVSLGLDGNNPALRKARSSGVARAMVFPDRQAGGLFSGQGARIDLAPGAPLLHLARAALFVTTGGGAADSAGGSRAASWGLLRASLDEARSLRGPPRPGQARDQIQNHLQIETLQAVLGRRMPLAIVAERESDIRQAIALANDFDIAIVLVGGTEAWRVAGLLAERKVPVILDPLENLPMNFDMIGIRRDNAALLERAGVLIGFMVSMQGIYLSYNLGPALREGAGMAVANGLPPAVAIRILTQNSAKIWERGATAAVLAPGAPASFVVWDGDPLEPSTAPRQVYFNGREISLRTRQTELRDRYQPHSR
ncbi:MAG: hypothetical protein R3E77_01610 [Steroidobacteraceae bacterium]